MKHSGKIFWLVVFTAIMLYLQIQCCDSLTYLEQMQMFLFTSDYASEVIKQPSGLAVYVSRFLTQFFCLQWVGAAIVAALLTAVGILFHNALKCIVKPGNGLLSASFALLPVCALMYLQHDFNYSMAGTVALLVALGAMCAIEAVRNPYVRLAVAIVVWPDLYMLIGPVAIVGVLLQLAVELIRRCPKWYLTLLPMLAVSGMATWCVSSGMLAEWRTALSADMYYDSMVSTMKLLFPYYAIVLALLLALGSTMLPNGYPKLKTLMAMLVVASGVGAFIGLETTDEADRAMRSSAKNYQRLTNGLWDEIIDDFEKSDRHTIEDYNVLHIALAEKGQLHSKLFAYRQPGVHALIAPWDNSLSAAMYLSEIYYRIGDIVWTQKLSFEGTVASTAGGSARLLKRLVDTNLICGEYRVAEKYIYILEHTLMYSDWAHERRRLLDNDSAVEADADLGVRRRAYRGNGNYAEAFDITGILERLAQNNPTNRLPIDYLTAFYMLTKDSANFTRIVEKYYGTEVLQSLSPQLQQAIVAANRFDFGFCLSHGVSESTINQFRSVSLFVEVNQVDSKFDELFYERYGDTYWYYLTINSDGQ
ncbi:MAG: DUF6057 family protein [Muribaculaceae bacterium]